MSTKTKPVGTQETDENGITWVKKWEALMPDLEARAVKVYDEMAVEGVLEGHDMSKEQFLEGFLFDTHPDWEIAKWEQMLSQFRRKAAGRGKLARARIWREGFDDRIFLETEDSSN